MLGESKTALSINPKHKPLNLTAMRPELELLAQIDAYIDKQLSKEDLLQFEQDLALNEELQQALQQQLDIREGLNYLSLKQKVNKAYKSYSFQKQLKTWGIISLIALASLGSYVLINSNKEIAFSPINNIITPSFDPEKGFEIGSRLPTEEFTISNASDTVIETSNGTVIAIPANSFNTDEQSVTFSIKEALTPEDIIKNGLSTFADKDELETAGMFHFSATDSKGDVGINKDKKIMVDVPTNNKKANMMVYDGETDSTGNVNWIKPEKLENFLTTVDIFSLNFYPPKFEEELIQLGYGNKPKAFKDSIYYSFFCGKDSEKTVEKLPSEEENFFVSTNGDTIVDKVNTNSTSHTNKHGEAAHNNLIVYDFSCGGIEPSKIKAIWNKQFQNSLIATREFEERLQLIFKTCNPEILNMYINGMKQPLYKLDSEAAKLDYGKHKNAFLELAKQYKGRVNMNNKTVALLNKYYQKKSNLYSKAAKEAHDSYWDKEIAKDQEAQNKTNKKLTEDQERRWTNYNDELKRNLYSMFEQAGLPKPKIRTSDFGKVYVTDRPILVTDIIPLEKYTFTVQTTGWKNLDRITADATARRKSIEVVNDNGKKAILSYSPLNVKIVEEKTYDYTMVYLTSPIVTSYFKLKKSKDDFFYQVNDSLKYNLIIVGYKGETPYIEKVTNIKNGSYSFSILETTEEELNNTIRSLCPNNSPIDIKKDLAYKKFLIQDGIRKKKNTEMKAIRNQLQPIIFPCGYTNESDSITHDTPVYWEDEF